MTSPRVLNALERAAASVWPRRLLRVIHESPPSTTIGDLVASVAGTPFEAVLRGLRLHELAPVPEETETEPAPVEVIEPVVPAGPPARRTRTRAGRAVFDTAVADFLRGISGRSVRFEEVQEAVGGTPHQVRQSLTRLSEAGSVSRSGTQEDTGYRWMQSWSLSGGARPA